MARIRIHELAAELGVESKVVVARANEIGIPARGHMTSLDVEEAEALKASLLAPPPEVVEEEPGLPAVDEQQAAGDEQSGASDVGPDAAQAVPPAEADSEQGSAAPAEAADDAADRPEPGNEREPRPRAPDRDRNRGRGGRRGPGGPHEGRGRREQPLSQEDPYWQFGTPPEYWGQTRGDRRTDPSGLPPDDPYWQFGSPVESWGSSRKKAGQPEPGRQQQRPRVYLECQKCGVKIEKKRAHGDRKVPCPFCNRWMREVR